MNALRWLSGLALVLVAGPTFGADRQKIVLSEVEVRSGPTGLYYPTSKLRQGDEVEILGAEQDMLKIVPPAGSFDWVNAADLEVSGIVATVLKPTELRRGSSIETQKNIGVAAPTKLEQGTILTVEQGPTQMAGKALLIRVRPPANDVRYIPKDAVLAPPGGYAPSAASSFPKIPEYDKDSFTGTPAHTFAAPAGSGSSMTAQNNQPSFPTTFQVPASQAKPAPVFGNEGPPPPLVPASYDPPQDNRRNDLVPPTFQSGVNRQGSRAAMAPSIPNYTTSALSVSRSTQMSGSLTDDPDWIEGEKLEESYAQTKQQDFIEQAIKHYDAVGKKYGQSDPALALRAMNRAQYLRNAISAGVIQQTVNSRSAKPRFGDTATSDVYSNGSSRSNVDSSQSRAKTAQSDVYPEAKYLPSEAAAADRKAKEANRVVQDLTQPTAKLTKPLMPQETPSSTAEKFWMPPGKLTRSTLEAYGKKFYHLEPDGNKPLVYCTSLPGVNLDDYVNKHVQIYGTFYYHKEVRQHYMEVLQVVEVQ